MEQFRVKTPHFSFILRVENEPTFPPKRKFYVGDSRGPCLEATIFLPSVDKLYKPHICILHQIDALEECAFQNVENDKASFGQELLFAFISILKVNYPHITQLAFRDTSYIPCNRRTKDTLDLLSYSIAQYGKTWYERVAGAYIPSPSRWQAYLAKIKEFIHPDTKKKYAFEELMRLIIQRNSFAQQFIEKDKSHFEKMYKMANTFPEFFQTLQKQVPKKDKCRFFKEWLEIFVSEYVSFERDWIIPIDTNSQLGNVLNMSQGKPIRKQTQRRKDI